MRRWENGKVIGRTLLSPEFQERFDAPYWVIHRAHLHEAMLEMALDLGVTLNFASKIVSYDDSNPSITLEDGSKASADLIVAADGMLYLQKKNCN